MVEDTVVGRRIYIHQHSFDFLAHQDTRLCNAVEGALARVRGMKLVRHYVLDNWLPLGLITRGVADQATRSFEDAFQTLTRLLRQVEYEDPARDALTAVLDSGESIVSSCFESGYYTFATDPTSAAVMFADHEPLTSLWHDVSTGVGPPDLTMTKGPRLFARGSQLSSIPGHRRRTRGLTVLPEGHQAVKDAVRLSLKHEVACATASLLPPRLTGELVSGVQRTLSAAVCEICAGP